MTDRKIPPQNKPTTAPQQNNLEEEADAPSAEQLQKNAGHAHEHTSSSADPNVDVADPTDGKERYQWESSYPPEARKHIRFESLYLVLVFFASLAFLLATWKGLPCDWLNVTGKSSQILRKYCYYISAGALGGAIFSIKYMYRVVARGYWHIDRRLWRLLSPIISLGVAFVFGALFDASILSGRTPASSAAIVGTGFLTGYFADQAIAKMYEVAHVLFGTTTKSPK